MTDHKKIVEDGLLCCHRGCSVANVASDLACEQALLSLENLIDKTKLIERLEAMKKEPAPRDSFKKEDGSVDINKHCDDYIEVALWNDCINTIIKELNDE